MGYKYNFKQHPIAPVGSKVLTWDCPEHRGTWADHGIQAVYLGPADEHFRAFNVWVPNTSAPRVTNTVWWFLHDALLADDDLVQQDPKLAYPPSKTRPDPRENGSDLLGRAFLEPELGVCVIIGMGPVTQHRLATRGQLQRQQQNNDPIIAVGAHYTLSYRQITTGEEHFSSVAEILNWIDSGPLLQPPTITDNNDTNGAPVTTPAHIPARLTYVPDLPMPSHANTSPNLPVTVPPPRGKQRVCKAAQDNVQKQRVSKTTKQRVLLPRKAKETQKQYVFSASTNEEATSNQNVLQNFLSDTNASTNEEATSYQNVLQDFLSDKNGKGTPHDPPNNVPLFVAPDFPPDFVDESIDDNIDRFLKWCEIQDHQVLSAVEADPDLLARAMPESNLPPVFPIGPLNLNPDGTDINYRKSHEGPNAQYWRQADGEEISRLLTTGTIRPL